MDKDPLAQFNKWFKEAQDNLPANSDIIVEATNFQLQDCLVGEFPHVLCY